MEKKFWRALLLIGIAMHILAAFLMPLGLDAHVHASYVSDGMDDGEAHLEWGELRPDSPDSSSPEEVPADDKWFAWHSLIQMWFTVFSVSVASLHILSLIGGLGCLATIFLVTRNLFDSEQALRLTALASIYPPLIRATGRFYQEGIILILITLAVYSIIRAVRDSKFSYWWVIPVLCGVLILSFKGMPLWYILPAIAVLMVSSRLEMNQIHIALIALFVQLVILYRNEVSLSHPDIVPALLSSFIGYFLFVTCGMLIISKDESSSNFESDLLFRGSKMVAACLIGWVAALWVTEAVALEKGFFDIVYSFRNNPRYFSLLLIPLWFSRLLKTDSAGLSSDNGENKIVVGLVSALLVINILVLSTTGTTGSEYVGSHLSDEITDDEDLLFVSDSPLAMHRLYSIKFSMDPDSDGESIGHWRSNDSGWQVELLECNQLSNVTWIFVFHDLTPSMSSEWEEIDFEGSDKVSQGYQLYKWGGEDERCA